MPVRLPTALAGPLSRRAVARRDALGLAREAVAAGCLVALEDPATVERIRAAGLTRWCELTVRVDTVPDAARQVSDASAAGLSVVLAGPAGLVDAVGAPGAGVVVPSWERGAEERCRMLAGRRVRLVAGRSRAGQLAFVRCLNVLMAAEGYAGIAVSDPRLIAIAGERAAWNGRPSESWELVMPYGELVPEQRRLVAAGTTVRVDLGVGR